MNRQYERRAMRRVIGAALVMALVQVPHAAGARARPAATTTKSKAAADKAKTTTARTTKARTAKAKPVAPKAAGTTKQAAVAKAAPVETAKPVRRGGKLYAVVMGPGPAWRKGQPLRKDNGDGHYRYWQDLSKQGVVESAGPVGNETGFALIHARNLKEANAMIEGDPAVKSGRFRAVARPYDPTIGGN